MCDAVVTIVIIILIHWKLLNEENSTVVQPSGKRKLWFLVRLLKACV